MTDREKLIELLGEDTCHRDGCYDCDYDGDRDACIEYLKNSMADHLLANGVTFASAVPGPSEADPNIMELCFHNGERHMKEKICKELNRIAKEIPTMTVSQAISMLEGL